MELTMYEHVLRPLLFALSRKDAERAHNFMVPLLQIAQNTPGLLEVIRRLYRPSITPVPVTIAGLTFPNRVGLAAGFDKQARLLPILEAFGFGHVEVGTVLPRKQIGNERPRVFRIPEHQALFNRMGFNSDGAVKVAARLSQLRRVQIPIGISLSKQKETSPERAVDDFLETQRITSLDASYFTVNLSSPNTPGLRKLQNRKAVEEIAGAVVRVEVERHIRQHIPARPVFLKVASDIENDELEGALEGGHDAGVSGFIIGNTSVKQPLGIPEHLHPGGSGGWSGPAIFPQVLERLRLARQSTKLPVILVGGISHPDQVKQAQDADATMLQIYSSFVYGGPRTVRDLVSVPW